MYMYACKQNDYNATYWASVVPYSIHACTKKHPKPFIRFHRHREWTSYFRVAPTCQNAESPLQVLRCRGPLLQNGDYLLSRLRSTIGVNGLNFSVRNGKRWNPVAIVTLITLYCHIHTNKLSFFSSKNPYTDASFKAISSSNTTELNVYHSLIKATSYGQLVMLGCDVTVYTPASYQRHRLWRPLEEILSCGRLRT